jgi:hypothetical protein
VIRRIAALTPLLFVGACAGGPQIGEITGDPSLSTPRTSALLVVERSTSAPALGAPSLAQVGARFVHFTGIAPSALPDLLGTPAIPEHMGCTQQELREPAQSSRAEVRLLDVGALEVRSGVRTLALEPRRLPDLFRVVSGVVYAAEGELDDPQWRFRGSGNGDARIPAFEVEAQAPEPLRGLSLDGQPMASSASLSLPRRGFVLRWSRGESADFVVAHFEGGAAVDRASPVVCTARDEAGALEVDASWSERIARAASEGRLVVHRIRIRPFTLANVDRAAVVFDSSVSFRLSAE